MSRISRFLASAIFCLSTVPAHAAPIQFGANFYDFVPAKDIAWVDAEAAAAASTFMSVNGHLATITSSGENDFLSTHFATFSGFAGAWLGGRVDVTGAGFWVVGPDTAKQFSQGHGAVAGAYANWGGIEPNNAPSAPYMNIGTLFSGIETGQWADAANGLSGAGDPIQGYIVEYEGSAPEPSSPALFGIALIGFICAKRARRCARYACS